MKKILYWTGVIIVLVMLAFTSMMALWQWIVVGAIMVAGFVLEYFQIRKDLRELSTPKKQKYPSFWSLFVLTIVMMACTLEKTDKFGRRVVSTDSAQARVREGLAAELRKFLQDSVRRADSAQGARFIVFRDSLARAESVAKSRGHK